MKRLALLLLLALWAGTLAAQGYKIGDEVEDSEVQNWVNPPALPYFSDHRGDVVVFKRWGVG
ncbi:MAG: hypothetical protein IT463_08830 [Planctomycetes bacterium]|nr:hypothetical protein [Planctomycetota bacterium]